MKKTIISVLVLMMISGTIIISCKKGGFSDNTNHDARSRSSVKGLDGLALVGCSQTLPATITADRTLNADSAYLISSCVKVQNGAVLTIPAGTVLLGQKSTNGTLVVERGSKIIANGTAMNPIVMTSDQPANSRQPGDWGGLIILGKANNNSNLPSNGVLDVDRACGTLVAGAVSGVTNDADNSGSLKYVQIHYAGGAVSGDEYPSALLLMAVGSQTEINNIQITNSRRDGLVVRGGTFNSKYIANYDNYKNDFIYQEGFRGNVQYLLSVRNNSNAHESSGTMSNALVINNDPSGSSRTPYTKAVITNASLYGPEFCGSSPVHADFQNGILIQDYAQGGVFNSLVTGWPRGLFIEGDNAVRNANNELLRFSYNTFYDYATLARFDFAASLNNWDNPSGQCVATMVEWIENPFSYDCANFGNEDLSSSLGASNTLCGSFCSTIPNFSISSSSMSDSVFPAGSMVDIAFFNKSGQLRGAFGSNDWTAGWTDFCPQSVGYCI